MRIAHFNVILATLILLAASTETRAEQKLADFERIVVADQPLAVQQAAAEELAHYASKISGRKIAIMPVSQFKADDAGLSFFVGDTVAQKLLNITLAPWKGEEYLLRSVPQGLILAGDDHVGNAWSITTAAGSMLATYTLLDDHLGVRWFWPGPFGEHVPSQPGAVIPQLNVRAVPKFEIRSVQVGYSRYHTAAFRDATAKWSRRSRLGWTRSAVFGHSWYDAFHLKTNDEFQKHPEWFALVNGNRKPPQMCTTHPEVLDRMVDFVLHGKADIMHISPSDGGGFCQCNEETKSETHKRLGIPSCTSLDVPGVLAYDGKTVQLSDRIFTYANEIARRAREQNPNKGVGMFAYTFYNKPPIRIEKLEPNLYLSFVYQSAAMRDPVAHQQWKDSVSGWQKIGAKMVVREGWGNHYYLDLPYLHDEQIVANLAEARQLGFLAAYGEGSKAFATQAPNSWAVRRMMWDPDRDQRTVMQDFYTSAYGPVAAEMQAFFDAYRRALDDNWQKRRRLVDTPIIAYANVINSWHLLFPEEVVQTADKHLTAAEAKVPAGSEYAERVAFHRFGQDYTRVMLDLLNHYRQLNELGMKLDSFRTVETAVRTDEAERKRLLQAAFELGETREKMLLAHRDWAAMDEGLYAFTNDSNIRQWHSTVKKALGIDRPSALTKESLSAK